MEEIFNDEELTQQVRDKNYTQLLSNPKIKAIFQDKELLDKIFALNKRIMESDFKTEEVKEVIEGRQPKVIDMEPPQE